jgi:hypothetical protein
MQEDISAIEIAEHEFKEPAVFNQVDMVRRSRRFHRIFAVNYVAANNDDDPVINCLVMGEVSTLAW